MNTVSCLYAIQSLWMTEAVRRLASHEPIREEARESLEKYFYSLIQAIESGDAHILDPILDGWIASRMRTDLDAGSTSIAPVIDQLLRLGIEICRDQLSEQDALEVISALIPLQSYMFSYITHQETQIQIEQLSNDLEEAQQSLEQIDKSKSDFISIAAHELKTPLTLIEGYAAMVREQAVKLDDTQIEILLKGIDNGTRRLREIVDDMVDVSLIDNNLLALNFQPVWINRLLVMVQDNFHEILDERGIDLLIRQFPGSEAMNFADGERLYQAFRNLVSNAIKYTPDGGMITIDGRLLPGFQEITFADTGIGIKPEDQVRIFEKFGRTGSATLHSSGKTKYKGGGPGLGLPIAKGIIEAHGGAIWVESEGYDEERYPGAVFHVLIPTRAEAPDNKVARLYQTIEKVKTEEIE